MTMNTINNERTKKKFKVRICSAQITLLQLKKNYQRSHSRSGDIRAHLTGFYNFVRSNPEIDLLQNKSKLFSVFEDILRVDDQAYPTSLKGQIHNVTVCYQNALSGVPPE